MVRDPRFNQMLTIPTATTPESVTRSHRKRVNPLHRQQVNKFQFSGDIVTEPFPSAFKLHVVCNMLSIIAYVQLRVTASREAVGQYSEMEAQLYDFILDDRAAGRCVTGGMIRQEALWFMVVFDILFELVSLLMI